MDFDAASPIYLQIGDFIKEEIVSGRLAPGSRLPSVREYGLFFEVSNLTIQRALQQLELENVIVTKKGVGSFVNPRITPETQQAIIARHAADFLGKMRKFGLDDAAILALVEKELVRTSMPGKELSL